MSESLALTTREQQVVNDVINKGAGAVNDGNIDQLISALLKTGTDTFKKAMAVISSDAKLHKDVVTQLSESAKQAITSSDKVAQKAMDNAKADSDAIRNLINAGNLTSEQLTACLDDLRYYAQEMFRIRAETQESQERIVENQKQTASEQTQKSSAGRDAAIGIGGFAAGTVVTLLILRLLRKI